MAAASLMAAALQREPALISAIADRQSHILAATMPARSLDTTGSMASSSSALSGVDADSELPRVLQKVRLSARPWCLTDGPV